MTVGGGIRRIRKLHSVTGNWVDEQMQKIVVGWKGGKKKERLDRWVSSSVGKLPSFWSKMRVVHVQRDVYLTMIFVADELLFSIWPPHTGPIQSNPIQSNPLLCEEHRQEQSRGLFAWTCHVLQCPLAQLPSTQLDYASFHDHDDEVMME